MPTATTTPDAWTALSDPTRRAVLATVVDGAASVNEIAAHFRVSRPAVSQHLRVLARADLVGVRPEGTRRIYYANPAALAAFRTEVEGFWRSSLTTFKALVETPGETP